MAQHSPNTLPNSPSGAPLLSQHGVSSNSPLLSQSQLVATNWGEDLHFQPTRLLQGLHPPSHHTDTSMHPQLRCSPCHSCGKLRPWRDIIYPTVHVTLLCNLFTINCSFNDQSLPSNHKTRCLPNHRHVQCRLTVSSYPLFVNIILYCYTKKQNHKFTIAGLLCWCLWWTFSPYRDGFLGMHYHGLM